MINVLLKALLMTLACGAAAPAVDANPTRDAVVDPLRLEVISLVEGVWQHITWRFIDGYGVIGGNGLVIETPDGIVVVDTPWGEKPAGALLEWIEFNLQQSPIAVLATHFHADSLGGAEAFLNQGIAVYTSTATQALAGPLGARLSPVDGLDRANSAVDWFGLELFFPGPAHTRDNLVVWWPGAHLLFGSCALRSPDHAGRGNVNDADLSAWPESLRAVRDRYPHIDMAVPGHGAAAGAELLDHTIQLFTPAPQSPPVKPRLQRAD